jgi:SAM-dependent methyltransferase
MSGDSHDRLVSRAHESKVEHKPVRKVRKPITRVFDFVSFPVRGLILFHKDKWGFSCLASERYDYVSREVQGYCLDVGCGYHNRFVVEWLHGNGRGIDVYQYEGLTKEQIVADMSRFPFDDASFDSVTFIANINHVPASMRDRELAEAYRCLRPGGNVIVTMGNPLTEILVHKVVATYDRFFGTHVDMDTERGMGEEEAYYLLDAEIVSRLRNAGFPSPVKKYFGTQWCLNHLWVGWKPKQS